MKDSKRCISTQFLEIKNFLKVYESFWNREILEIYPHIDETFPSDWIDELFSLNPCQLWHLDSKKDFSFIKNPSFVKYLEKINALESIPQDNGPQKKYPHEAFFKINPKKKHEVSMVSSLVSGLLKKHSFSHAVDIGGGVGYLARILTRYENLDTYSLDCDGELQNKGHQIFSQKYKESSKANLTFCNVALKKPIKGYQFKPSIQENTSTDLSTIFNENTLSIGLHTCGGLALDHLKTSIEYKSLGILNFGCCYSKLDIDKELNLSSLSQKNPLSFTVSSLTLAQAWHQDQSDKEFFKKLKVKEYRYGLHLYLYKHEGIKDMIKVGPSHFRDYQWPFSQYAQKKLKELELRSPSKIDLDDFFKKESIQFEIKKMFLANIIRWQLGRLVEYYILLDRALWIEENGHEVSLKTYFDPLIGPRNIGILAIRNNNACS